MTLERAGRNYGDGVLLGDRGDEFVNLSWEEQAKQLGWSVACPVVLRLIDQRGDKEMAKRYGEILSWSGVVGGMLADEGYEQIRDEMLASVDRERDEPLGEWRDDEWIPEELHEKMFGPATPEGYAIPRLITSFLEGSEDRSARAMEALEIVDEAIDELCDTSDLTEFAVLMAKGLASAGEKYNIPAGEFFHQLLGTGKLKEDNCREGYGKIVDTMSGFAYELYEKYVALSPEEIAQHHVAVDGVDF